MSYLETGEISKHACVPRRSVTDIYSFDRCTDLVIVTDLYSFDKITQCHGYRMYLDVTLEVSRTSLDYI
jgi:hypothetical protein